MAKTFFITPESKGIYFPDSTVAKIADIVEINNLDVDNITIYVENDISRDSTLITVRGYDLEHKSSINYVQLEIDNHELHNNKNN